MPAWGFLAIAISAEIVGTMSLRASHGFTRLAPSLVVVTGYVIAFYMLSQALKTMSLGTAYAIWSGVGTAMITVLGIMIFGDRINGYGVFGIALIVAGVMVLQLLGAGEVKSSN